MVAPKASRFVVRGHVQGVGFRYFAQRRAAALGLAGYVRNLGDGSVEAVATGTPEALDAFAEALRQGPSWARVTALEEAPAAPEGLPRDEFHIRG